MATFTNTIINANIETTRLATGITMEYVLHGPADAPVLCFIHGLGSNLRQFLPQAAYFGERYRVLLLSLRRHGGTSSPNPATAAGYTTSVLAQDVVALLEHLGIAALHVVGNSLGGLVGYALLQHGTPQLHSLTTFGTTAELHRSRFVYWGLVGSVWLLGVNGLARLVGKTGSRDPAVGPQLERLYRQASKAALSLIPQHIANYDYTNVLRQATIPLLLIQGEHDQEINKNLTSTLTALDAAVQAQVAPLVGAGHFANLEQPAAFNELVDTFLTQLRTVEQFAGGVVCVSEG
ncbi:MAG: alpha/beta fold hydrolase [Chloroflexia bacterium]|nr:alpha/beta fold hydrolase [Chloroflexia bacterium]